MSLHISSAIEHDFSKCNPRPFPSSGDRLSLAPLDKLPPTSVGPLTRWYLDAYVGTMLSAPKSDDPSSRQRNEAMLSFIFNCDDAECDEMSGDMTCPKKNIYDIYFY